MFLFIPNFSRNLISVSCLQTQSYILNFSSTNCSISRNGFHICVAPMEQGLYVLRPNTQISLSSQLFNVAKPRSLKRKEIDNDDQTYLWHLRLGHIGFDRLNRLTKGGPLKNVVLGELPVASPAWKEK